MLVAHLLPHLAMPVDVTLLGPDAIDNFPQFLILTRSGRARRRIPLLRFVSVVRRWSDRQHAADRLDSIRRSMLVNERHHHFARRSSSACAKNADALRKISFARFNSRFSR